MHVLCKAPFSGEYGTARAWHLPAYAVEGYSPLSPYDSGTGWPSFFDAINEDAISRKEDLTHNMVRVEILCKKCGSHLGHVLKTDLSLLDCVTV